MLQPCPSLVQMTHGSFKFEPLQSIEDRDCCKSSQCCFFQNLFELRNDCHDRYIYIYNACGTQTGTGEHRAGDDGWRIEAVPAIGHPATDADAAVLQLEIGAWLYGYDTVLIDLDRMGALQSRAGRDASLDVLSGLCRRLGLTLIGMRACACPAPPAPVTPAS